MKERALPTIDIQGTEFLVDVNKLELREKADPKNTILIFDMRDEGDGYAFWYGLQEKCIPHILSSNEKITVKIPELVKLDPEGMAMKYNAGDLTGKSDFDLMVDQVALHKRIRLGELPTIDIAGHTFYADARLDLIRPKDDFTTLGIHLPEIEGYFEEKTKHYLIPYNPKTHEFEEPDYDNLTAYPKDLIAVEFPHERVLDPIGWNRRWVFNETQNLKRTGLKLQFKAAIIPWGQTIIEDIIKENLQRLKPEKVKPIQPLSNPEGDTKKRGPRR